MSRTAGAPELSPGAQAIPPGPPRTVAAARFRRVVGIVACLNLLYFGVEFGGALAVRSVSLLADSADFFEDAAVNFLIFVALSWQASRRATVGKALAFILLVPAVAFLWAIWGKLQAPTPPEPLGLSVLGAGAFLVNLSCAILLVRHRHHGGSLARAAFLSARNDVLVNIAIVAAGLATAWHPSVWPDVVVGLGVAVINIGAAHDVWKAASAESAALAPQP